jgi:uncharacterized small protein (DUF1192 family)
MRKQDRLQRQKELKHALIDLKHQILESQKDIFSEHLDHLDKRASNYQ